MNKPYDLEEGVSEFFEFKFKEGTYKFRYPTTDEISEFGGIDQKENKSVIEFLTKFITASDDKSPEFSKISKQMNIRHWSLFTKMITTEFSINGQNNPSPTNSQE